MEHEIIDISRQTSASIKWGFDNKLLSSTLLGKANLTLKYIGDYVSSINLKDIIHVYEILPATLDHCANLEHLRLRGCDLTDYMVDPFIDALNGDLGDRLLTLDLDVTELGSAAVEKISQFLTNPVRTPALLKLRIFLSRLQCQG